MNKSKKPPDKILSLIIWTTAIFGVIHIILAFFKESVPILAEIPMFIPMIHSFGALAALCIIIMSLGRQRVLQDSVSYWVGVAFISVLTGNIFYILSWPGLLSDGQPIIGHLTGTAAWIISFEHFLIGIFLILAAVSQWPGSIVPNKRKRVLAIGGWVFLLTMIFLSLVIFENYLPQTIKNGGQFTTASNILMVTLIIINVTGAFLMFRKYLRKPNQMVGYIVLTQVFILFSIIESLMSIKRYAILWYSSRLMGVSAFLILLFGFLREYIMLFRNEQKRSLQLIESERKTMEVLSSIADCNYHIDKEWCVTYINEKALEYFGMKRENFIGKVYWEIFPFTRNTIVEENFRKSVSQNIAVSFEMPSFVKKAWAEFHLYPSDDGLSVYFRDITERKLFEEKIQTTLNRFYLILSSLQNGILLVTNDNKVEFVNETFCKFFGIKESPAELSNISATEIIEKVKKSYFNADESISRIREIVSNNKIVMGEDVFMSNGQTFLRDFIPISLGDKQFGRLWNHIEITERKKVEEEVRENKEKFSSIFNLSPLAMSLTSFSDGIYHDVNYAFLKDSGYSKEEVIGKTSADLNIFSNIKDRTNIIDVVKEKGHLYGMPCDIRIKNGDIVPCLLSISIISINGIKFFLSITQNISEYISTKEALNQSEDRFRAMAEVSPVGMGVVDYNDGKFLYVNPSYEKFSGYNENELLSKISPDLYWDINDRDLIRNKLKENNFVENYEVKLKKKDGSSFWSLSSVRKIKFMNKPALLGTFIDINERKQAEEKLEKSEKSFRRLAESAFEGLLIHEDGLILDINTPLTQIIGYHRDEIIGKSILDFTPPEYHTIMKEGIRTPYEMEVFQKDGTRIPVEIMVKPFVIKDQVVAAIRDIRERKLIEDTLLFLSNSGWNSYNEDFFQSLAKYLAKILKMDFVCIDLLKNDCLTATTVAMYFDGKFEDNISYTLKDTPCGEVVDKQVCCFSQNVRYLFPKDKLLQEMKAESYVGVTLRNSDGKRIGLIAVIGRNPLTNPRLAETILNLVTGRTAGELERRKTEKKLESYASELKELNATKDKFFRIIAHDLKNPFFVLVNASELLAKNAEKYSTERIKEYGKILYSTSKSGYSVLENLLEWSKSQTGIINFNPEEVKLSEIISKNITDVEAGALNKEIVLAYTVDKEMIITADKNMLNTVLRNLLNNAIKFTGKGGNISVSAKRENNHVTLSVKDSGIGISQADIDKLFRLDTKYTNLGTENEIGSGLGLILCKEFVERHGGKIWVESEENKGSVFKFSIPVN